MHSLDRRLRGHHRRRLITHPRSQTRRLATPDAIPIWPVATAAIGVYLVRSAYTLTFPTSITGTPGLTAAIGAALLGAATAATIARHFGIRLAVGLIVVPGYALVVTVPTIGYLVIAYTATLIWWHLTATAGTLRDATPDHPLTRRLAKT